MRKKTMSAWWRAREARRMYGGKSEKAENRELGVDDNKEATAAWRRWRQLRRQ